MILFVSAKAVLYMKLLGREVGIRMVETHVSPSGTDLIHVAKEFQAASAILVLIKSFYCYFTMFLRHKRLVNVI